MHTMNTRSTSEKSSTELVGVRVIERVVVKRGKKTTYAFVDIIVLTKLS